MLLCPRLYREPLSDQHQRVLQQSLPEWGYLPGLNQRLQMQLLQWFVLSSDLSPPLISLLIAKNILCAFIKPLLSFGRVRSISTQRYGLIDFLCGKFPLLIMDVVIEY